MLSALEMEENLLNLLPTELKETVLKFITNPVDLYNLSIVSKEYGTALNNVKNRTFDVATDYRFTHELSANIFKWFPNVTNITYLNLNGIYWLQAAVIRSFMKKLTNLETALLIDTKISCSNLDKLLYQPLEKLKILAISRDEEKKRKRLVVFMVENHKEHCTKKENDNFILQMQKAQFVILPKRDCLDQNNFKNGMDWMNNVIKRYSADLEVTHGYIDELVISYGELLELIKQEDVQDKYLGTKGLIILNSLKRKKPELPEISSIDYITKFTNLQKLSLEVNETVNCNFLEKLFKECKNLKSLKIKTKYPQFTLSYLQHATALEEISFYTNGHFQLDKFVLDLLNNNHIKLKRIYLKFWKLQRLSEKPFNRFLKDNTQLIFFRIDCEMTESLVKRLNSVLKSYVLNPQQIFQINRCNVKDSPEYFNIPISHIDMLQEHGFLYKPGGNNFIRCSFVI